MFNNDILVKTDRYDGPLGLLLLLIQREDMSIRDLNINTVTRQYLEYLTKMREINFDIAGEYLYLAATLLLLKSKNSISDEEQDSLKDNLEADSDLKITSQADLIYRLEQLQHYQILGKQLWELPKKGHEVFVKPKINRKEIINSILTPIDLSKLTISMIEFIQKELRKYTVIKREGLSLTNKLNFLKEFLKKDERIEFDEILLAENMKEDRENDSIDNIIITFISILELARLKKVSLFQNKDRSKIYVDVLESFENFNINLADGFEEDEIAENSIINNEQNNKTVTNELALH